MAKCKRNNNSIVTSKCSDMKFLLRNKSFYNIQRNYIKDVL